MKKLLILLGSITTISSTSSLVLSCQTPLVDAEFYFLSVGNANFTYLLENGTATVFDAGYGRSGGEDSLESRAGGWRWEDRESSNWAIDFMKQSGVKRVESIFISHQHTDHYNMVKKVAEEFDVNTVYAPYHFSNLSSELKNTSVKNVVSKQWQKEYKSNGRKITNITGYASKEAQKEALNGTENKNDTSMVLRFNLNGKMFLLPGDMTNQTFPNDKKFNKKVSEKNIDILMAAHHGSGNSLSSTYELLAQKKHKLDHFFVSGTNDTKLNQEDDDWSQFSGGHPFPSNEILTGIINYYADNDIELDDNSIHVTGSLGQFGEQALKRFPQIDAKHANHSFKYVSNKSNGYKGEVVAINDNVTRYNEKSSLQKEIKTIDSYNFSNINIFERYIKEIIIDKK